MKWVTREHAKVDRIACPWLIKNFVDTDAEFLFVPAHTVLEVAKEQNIPFDVPDVELGHHNDNDTEWIQFLFIYKGQRISIYHVFETTSGDLIYQ